MSIFDAVGPRQMISSPVYARIISQLNDIALLNESSSSTIGDEQFEGQGAVRRISEESTEWKPVVLTPPVAECNQDARISKSLEQFESDRKIQLENKVMQKSEEYHAEGQRIRDIGKQILIDIRTQIRRQQMDSQLRIEEELTKQQESSAREKQMDLAKRLEMQRIHEVELKVEQEKKARYEECLKTVAKSQDSTAEIMVEIGKLTIAYRSDEEIYKKVEQLLNELNHFNDYKVADSVASKHDAVKLVEAECRSIVDEIHRIYTEILDAVKGRERVRNEMASVAREEGTKPQDPQLAAVPKPVPVNSLPSQLSRRLQEYESLLAKLAETKVTCKQFIEDRMSKKLRMDYQKAVNTNINSISSLSGTHLLDKVARLSKLLRDASKFSNFSTLIWTTNLIAEKCVEQGETQVSSNPEAAFPVAAVVVALWSEFPDFGQLVLAHFYHKCPCLVPFIPEKGVLSDNDYKTMVGYQFTDGNAESTDKYLKRMGGLVRLYAAIMQVSPPPQRGGFGRPPTSQTTNPHSVDKAWSLIAALLNNGVICDVISTLLYHVLDVCGHCLYAKYGSQFSKLLHALCRDYFVRLKRGVSADCSGPLTRLEIFLQRSIKQGGISVPPGQLTDRFWTS